MILRTHLEAFAEDARWGAMTLMNGSLRNSQGTVTWNSNAM